MRFGRRALLSLLLGLFTVPALAQSMGFGLGMQHVVVRAGGGAGVTDIVANAPAAIYSLRKVKASYLGPAAKLRRTTGGTSDIGFVGGDFDTAAAATFCSATSCFFDTWYDQSGFARHATQATLANQPAYVADCGNGKPCARATTATQLLQTSSITWAAGKTTLSAVAQRTGGTASRCYVVGKGNSLAGFNTLPESWLLTDFVTEFNLSGATEGVWHTTIGEFNAASTLVRIDAVETAGGNVAGSASGPVGVVVGGAGITCNVSEAIIWDNYTLTLDERVALSNNQHDYWIPYSLDAFTSPSAAYSFRKLKSTYNGPAVRLGRALDTTQADIGFVGFVPGLGSPFDIAAANAFCAGTTCFPVLWYDQSGNSQNMAPTAAPTLVLNCVGTSKPCVRTTLPTQNMFINLASWWFSAGKTMSINGVGRQLTRVAPGGYLSCMFVAAGSNKIFQHADYDVTVVGNDSYNLSIGGVAGLYHSYTGVFAASGGVARVDALAEVTGTALPGDAGNIYVASGDAATCDFTELAVWLDYTLGPGERAMLHTNQKSFWGF